MLTSIIIGGFPTLIAAGESFCAFYPSDTPAFEWMPFLFNYSTRLTLYLSGAVTCALLMRLSYYPLTNVEFNDVLSQSIAFAIREVSALISINSGADSPGNLQFVDWAIWLLFSIFLFDLAVIAFRRTESSSSVPFFREVIGTGCIFFISLIMVCCPWIILRSCFKNTSVRVMYVLFYLLSRKR